MTPKRISFMTDSVEISLTDPVPDFLTKEVGARMTYVDERIRRGSVSDDGSAVHLQLHETLAPEALQDLAEKVERAVAVMRKGARPFPERVTVDELSRAVPFSDDPMPSLCDIGAFIEEAPGIVSLGPPLSLAFNAFRKLLYGVADTFDAAPYRFPAMIPAGFLERIGYLSRFPHSVSFLTHLREDIDLIEAFSEHACCDHGGAIEMAPSSLADVRALMTPATCHHFYLAKAGTRLTEPLTVATADAPCFRHESGNMTSLERTWNFTMWEVVFIGTERAVSEAIRTAAERGEALLREIGMAFRTEAANDPFFIGEFGVQSLYQHAHDLKYEFRARIPYRDDTIAVGSRNFHQDFFGRSLDILQQDGTPAYTGCVAFGLERLAFALVCQYGPSPEAWPDRIRAAL